MRVVLKNDAFTHSAMLLTSPLFRQFCKLLIDQFISKLNTLLCLSCWYHYLKWFKVIFWLSGAVAIPHNIQIRSWGGVVKYELSLYFRQLCDLCMSVRAFSPLRFKLFPRSSPNPNECTHERSKSMQTLIHELQRFRNKADGYLTTPKLGII